ALMTKLVAMRTVALMICAGILSAAFCQDSGESKEMATPALPFYDWGAYPYETCAYRQWAVHRSVTVYDTWKSERRPIGHLAVGDQVTGITGAVVTFKPGLIRMDRDLPDQDLRRGDTVLTTPAISVAMGMMSRLRSLLIKPVTPMWLDTGAPLTNRAAHPGDYESFALKRRQRAR